MKNKPTTGKRKSKMDPAVWESTISQVPKMESK
jgi:hypothetical protein